MEAIRILERIEGLDGEYDEEADVVLDAVDRRVAWDDCP